MVSTRATLRKEQDQPKDDQQEPAKGDQPRRTRLRRNQRMAASADFKDANDLWDQIQNVESLTALISTMGTFTANRFDFNGYDSGKILQRLYEAMTAAKIGKAVFIQDLTDIVLIGLSRGNIREDQMAKTVDGGADKIRELATRYKIPIKNNASSRVQVDGGTLTFVRSINLFPHLASLILHKLGYVSKDVYPSSLKTQELPEAMKHTGFSGLIPDKIHMSIQTVFIYAHLAYMVDFSRQINPNHRSMSTRDVANIQSNFTKNSLLNSRYTNDVKIEYFAIFELNKVENFQRVFNVANRLYQDINGDKMPELEGELFKDNVVVTGYTGTNTKALLDAFKVQETSITIQDRQGVTNAPSSSSAPRLKLPW